MRPANGRPGATTSQGQRRSAEPGQRTGTSNPLHPLRTRAVHAEHPTALRRRTRDLVAHPDRIPPAMRGCERKSSHGRPGARAFPTCNPSQHRTRCVRVHASIQAKHGAGSHDRADTARSSAHSWPAASGPIQAPPARRIFRDRFIAPNAMPAPVCMRPNSTCFSHASLQNYDATASNLTKIRIKSEKNLIMHTY
jgi:hypothetical protein